MSASWPIAAWCAPLALSQYAKEVWTSREGLPEGSILSLVEDGAEHLWVGNECCLVRFDGETFTRMDTQSGIGQHSFAHVLVRAGPDDVWAGFAGGLAHFTGNQMQWFAEEQGLTHPYVYALAITNSALWIGTGGEGVWHIKDRQISRDSTYAISNPSMIKRLLTDSSGRVWAATENGLLRQNTEGAWVKVTTTGLPSQTITQLAEAIPGEIWVGTSAGLALRKGTDFEAFPPMLNLPISALHADRNHILWAGSGDTLFRLSSTGVESLALNEGTIGAITDDTAGNIWVGTSNGLVRLHPGAITTFGKYEGLASDAPLSALARSSGGIWIIDNSGTLGHFVDGQYSQDTPNNSIEGGSLLGMTEDADGVLWIAGANLYRFAEGKLQAIDLPGDGFSLVESIGRQFWLAQTAPDGISSLYRFANNQLEPIDLGLTLHHVQRIHQDRAGQIWITSGGSGVVRIKDNTITQITKAHGLPSDTVYDITEDLEGRMWLATREGLGFVEGDKVVSLAGVKEAPHNATVHIFLDTKDRFWVTETGRGIYVLPRSALLNALHNPAQEVPAQVLTTRDGLRSLTFSWRHGGMAASQDGFLYVLTQRGLSQVQPEHYEQPIFDGQVHIDSVSVGAKDTKGEAVQLHDRREEIDITYGAALLTDSKRLEFRTRLGDDSTAWSQPTQSRSVRLSNLAPGEYTFEVAVRHLGQAWLTPTARLHITVPPYFYERRWVQALAGFLLLSLVAAYFRLRIQQAKNREIHLRNTVEERTAELNREIVERKYAESKALDLAQNLEERVQERTVELEYTKMAVLKSEERFALAVQGAEDGIWDWDLAQHTLYLSPRWKAILGYKDHELPTTIDAWLAAVHPEDLDLVRDLLIFADPHPNIRQEYRMMHREGHEIWVLCRGVVIRDPSNDLPLRAAGSQTDITQRKLTEEALRDSLTRDPVTELPNRALFLDRLDQALLKRRNQESQVTILLLDIDGFKLINEKYGHAAGDDILRQIAQRILSSLRQTDTLARLGNDEFAILLLEIEEQQQAQFAIERIKTVLDAPINIGHQTLNISYSMGVKNVQQGETQADEMLIDAENALGHAKERGGNQIQTVDKKTKGRRELEVELIRAMQENEFTLYYQPLIDLDSNRVVSTEALARWNHPEKGLLGPQHFISLLEACGLMDIFSEWVLTTCCTQAAVWHREFPGTCIGVSFNLPASHLNNPRLVDHVLAALSVHNLPAHALAIEIVENSLIESNIIVLNNLERLQKIGLPVSIDDFGTGYSSMNYLKQFPVDCIKLDKSFCQGVPDNARDVAICESLLAIAEQLGLKAIVEGVETEKQMEFFRSKPKLIAQGYFFSRPIEAAACTDFIRQSNFSPPRNVAN